MFYLIRTFCFPQLIFHVLFPFYFIFGLLYYIPVNPICNCYICYDLRKILSSFIVAARPASTSGYPVIGVIDGKFESGYLVTVTIGSEKLKGVLYQSPQDPIQQVQPSHNVRTNNSANARAVSGVQRRRRRKKSEIKRRDPAHPKPNRSGYNFFFAEQHARLKPLHPGKDREISRMIGGLWNAINDSEKAVRIVSSLL